MLKRAENDKAKKGNKRASSCDKEYFNDSESCFKIRE